jgi:hypothetical protein
MVSGAVVRFGNEYSTAKQAIKGGTVRMPR